MGSQDRTYLWTATTVSACCCPCALALQTLGDFVVRPFGPCLHGVATKPLRTSGTSWASSVPATSRCFQSGQTAKKLRSPQLVVRAGYEGSCRLLEPAYRKQDGLELIRGPDRHRQYECDDVVEPFVLLHGLRFAQGRRGGPGTARVGQPRHTIGARVQAANAFRRRRSHWVVVRLPIHSNNQRQQLILLDEDVV